MTHLTVGLLENPEEMKKICLQMLTDQMTITKHYLHGAGEAGGKQIQKLLEKSMNEYNFALERNKEESEENRSKNKYKKSIINKIRTPVNTEEELSWPPEALEE